MCEHEPYFIIEEARRLVHEKKIIQAEKKYEDVLSILEKRLDQSNKSKAELWSTKAEYLIFRAKFLHKEEPIEVSRQRLHNALRYLYKCSKINAKYSDQVSGNLRNILNNAILSCGCIVPENNNYVTITCPIKLRNIGFGLSAGILYKRAMCSICDLDMLDEKCNHVPGDTYDGKTCILIPDEPEIDHVSITDSPKDPRCLLTSIGTPKKEFYENFTKEQIKYKIENNLPIVCSSCREECLDPFGNIC